jgi:hypothetical protein
VTFAVAGWEIVNEKCATPGVSTDTVTSWWTRLKRGVGEAPEAEGHVTVARLKRTTPSARHQFGSRSNMIP